MTQESRDELYNSIILFMRKEHPEALDKAYEFFWEEEYPEDFLSGLALELAFVNFEDWLVCDYRSPKGVSVIEMYKESGKVDEKCSGMLEAISNSFISVYEVVSTDGGLRLRDLVLDEEVAFEENPLPQLQQGSVFAARVIRCEGRNLMGRCVYPFTKETIGRVMDFLEHNLKRYRRHKNPEGGMRQFLSEESYIINTIWVSCLYMKK